MINFNVPLVTLATTALLALLASVLAVRVIVKRVKLKVEWGDGGQTEMAQAVRAHANFAELVPMALFALAACETVGTPRLWVVALALSLVAARLLSALGLSQSLGPSLPRQSGASITLVVTSAAALLTLVELLRAI
jgi:uncharacterized protein